MGVAADRPLRIEIGGVPAVRPVTAIASTNLPTLDSFASTPGSRVSSPARGYRRVTTVGSPPCVCWSSAVPASSAGRSWTTPCRRGDDVTLFHRGRSGADLFPAVTRRLGDRDSGDYASLASGTWDAVVDVSAYLPRHVAQAIAAVGQRCGRYLFISTGSVYDRAAGGTRWARTRRACRRSRHRGHRRRDIRRLKVACEDDVLAHFGDRATIVRPGVVAGPYDPTDRFTWWVRRAARGGRVALPGGPSSRCRWWTPAIWPASSRPCSATIGRASSTRSGRPTRSQSRASSGPAPTRPGPRSRSCRYGRTWSSRASRSCCPTPAGTSCSGAAPRGPRGRPPGDPARGDGRRGAGLGPRAG